MFHVSMQPGVCRHGEASVIGWPKGLLFIRPTSDLSKTKEEAYLMVDGRENAV